MMKKKIKFFCLFFALGWPLQLFAQNSLQSVLIQPSELPQGWGMPHSNYSVSQSASIFFESFEALYANKFKVQLKDKIWQSFAGPTKGTVFYLNFENSSKISEVESYAKKLIWEGAGSTSEHPEKIFVRGSTLIIISVSHPGMSQELEKILQSK